MIVLKTILKSMRPRQWAKNVFVLAPLLFALEAGHLGSLISALIATFMFCMVSGTVYLLNDIVDRESDAEHPDKQHRPIASGALPVPVAMRATAIVLVATHAVALFWNPMFALTLASFFALNVAYSFWVKHLPILDVLFIAGGFLLRVVGGAVAIDVPFSLWILACTFLLSMYLGLGKRLHELRFMGDRSQRTRQVLRRYDLRWATPVFLMVGLLTVVSFGLYTVSSKALLSFGTRNLLWGVPLVAVGLARFAILSFDSKRPRSPTDALLSDPWILISALLWAIVAVMVLYLGFA